MSRKYTRSQKRLEAEMRQADWELRLEVLRLRTRGWTYQQIADKYNVSRQNIFSIYKKIKTMPVSQATAITQYLETIAA